MDFKIDLNTIDKNRKQLVALTHTYNTSTILVDITCTLLLDNGAINYKTKVFNKNINNENIENIREYLSKLEIFRLLVNKSIDYEKSSVEISKIKKLETKITEKSATEKIKELKELLDINAITQEEFDNKKTELLSKV